MAMVTANEEGTTRRVLTRAQSNIAPDDGGVAYSLDLVMIGGGIAATHAVRDGVIEGTARQVKADADGAGYSWATVRRVQKTVVITAVKDGMKEGWTWQL
jgi:putative DNA primase/helicase